ncbi:MAG: translocation/assembly module TamB domain-containing protein [Chthoniobacterales bacterium]
MIIFHRPLFFEATRYFVVRAARQQNLKLNYEISGSIFSTLRILDLQATPTEPGPILRLEVKTINLQYSLVDLIFHGLPAFLKTLEIEDAYVEVTSRNSSPKETSEPQQLKFPALFPKLLRLTNINFISHGDGGDTTLAGLSFSLLPDGPGSLNIQMLEIPEVHQWKDISGITTFKDRNLILTNLVLDSEISLKRFNLDASRLDSNELGIGLDGVFFQAPVSLACRVTDLNGANHLDVRAECSGLSFETLQKYLHLSTPLYGKLSHGALQFVGEYAKPNAWTGQLSAQFDELALDQQSLGALTLQADIKEGRAYFTAGQQFDPKNYYALYMEAALPKTCNEFSMTRATGYADVALPDLSSLTASLPHSVDGALTAHAKLDLADGNLNVNAAVDSSQMGNRDFDFAKAKLTIQIKKNLTENKKIFETLESQIQIHAGDVRVRDYMIDTFDIALRSEGADVFLENCTATKSANSVHAKARYTLPDDFASWWGQPLSVDFTVDAPNLQSFVATNSDVTLKGTLSASGHATAKDGIYDGNVKITGRQIVAQGLPVRSIDASMEVAKNQMHLTSFDMILNDSNALHASGEIQFSSPFSYQVSLNGKLKDLSIFQPLMGNTPDKLPLGGALSISWSGHGDANPTRHFGQASIDLTGGRFGKQTNLAAHMIANYSPEFIDIPDFHASAGTLGEASLSLAWKNNRLQIPNLTIRQQKQTLLEGSVDMPLDLQAGQSLDTLIPNDQPLKITLRTKEFDLSRLFAALGQSKPPLRGRLNLDLDAQGSINALQANVAFRGLQIQSTSAEKIAPADISLDANLRENQLQVQGSVHQRLINPLEISGNLPFDVAAIKNARAIDPGTPLDFHVALPKSSLTFLSTLVPAIRKSQGEASIDLKLNGTIEKPQINGNIIADLSVLRFTDPGLSPINNFALRMNFTKDRATLERCTASVAGGILSADGSITFASLDNPIFALRIRSTNALLLQNDDITVRASSDLRITGPMNSGLVAGEIGITRSRLFKSIDILPMALPGRPAPQPPSEPTIISFSKPPLRDWKFDVRIRTIDPFLIQGNLANGRIVMDLKLGGTGVKPWMEGLVRIDQLTASLPLSRLEIESGRISFTRDHPFIPRLEIRATSHIRDYDVYVFINGLLTDPGVVFSSNPPLSQADILSLLATGTTTEELSHDPNILAGHATMLFLQKAYRSIFRSRDDLATPNTFFNNVQFDIGSIDPKTNKQHANTRILLPGGFALVGGLDAGGNFQGRLRYLIRFK